MINPFRNVTLIELIVIFSIFLIIFMMIGGPLVYFFNTTTQDIVVEKVESVSRGGGYTYLIFTNDEVYEDCDIRLRGKWNSSDSYNQLRTLGKFNVTTCGFRVQFLSMYRKILRVNKKYEDETSAEKEKRRAEYEKLKKEFEK